MAIPESVFLKSDGLLGDGTLRTLVFLGVLLGSSAALGSANAAGDRRPNIVFILADDLGWRDVACYGSRRYETPHIDSLARRGLRFTQAHSASPLCSPTRASILTGLFPARIGITVPVCHLEEEVLESTIGDSARRDRKSLEVKSATRLNLDYFTLAESLKTAGYATAHFGKWHLGAEPYDPLHQGFDVDLPHAPVPGPYPNYLAPWKFWPGQGKPGDHIEDRMAHEAVTFIRAHKNGPFFVNYWAFSVHAPYKGKAEYIERYRSNPPGPEERQRCPEYAAMVRSLDDAVGTLVDALEKEGLIEDTVVIFTSDNGGNMYDEVDGVPPTDNHPLRSGKASFYDGGTRVPCIVWWPGLTKPGTQTDAPIMSTDFFPTFCDALGIPTGGVRFDGKSFAPLLRGEDFRRGPMFCHFPHPMGKISMDPASWVRDDDWKLIRLYNANDAQADRFELYNTRADIGETDDLSARHPERVAALSAMLDRFLTDSGAKVPPPNPEYDRDFIQSVGGWRAAHDAEWRRSGDEFVLKCTANDPHIVADMKPAVRGPFRVEVSIRSNGRGPATVYWSSGGPFERSKSVTFPMTHDDGWHAHCVEIVSKAAIKSLRLDPGSAPADVHLSGIRLLNDRGETLRSWKFAEAR